METLAQTYARLMAGAGNAVSAANTWAQDPQNADLLRFGTQISEGGVMPTAPGSAIESYVVPPIARKLGGMAATAGLNATTNHGGYRAWSEQPENVGYVGP